MLFLCVFGLFWAKKRSKITKIQEKCKKYAKKFAYIKNLLYLCTRFQKQTNQRWRQHHKNGNKIMTRNQLQAAAEKAGVKFEINPRYIGEKHYNPETGEWERYQFGWFFGINNLSGRDDYSWTWFESIGDMDEFMFVERYSMRTGKSNKGWRERMSAHERVAMLNGITINELFDIK